MTKVTPPGPAGASSVTVKVKLVVPALPSASDTSPIDSPGASKENAPARVALPPGVVTATSTAPAAWAGVTAVIWVALSTVKLAAGVPPNVTAVASVRSVPVSVTLVPPATGPVAGATAVRVGAAAAGEQRSENVSELGGS